MPSSFQSDVEQVVRIAIKADPTVPQKLAQELRDVQASMESIALAAPGAGTSVEVLANDLLKLQQRADLLQMAISTTRTSFIKDTGAMSRAWIEFARGAEDYSVAGFVGALNNIPGVVYNMGAAFGMATPQLNAIVTAVSLGGTAALVLGKNWSSIMSLFGQGHTQTEAEHMKELGKQTEKTAAETDKLNRYKERQSAIDKMLSAKTDEQKARREAVEEAVGGDTRGIAKGLTDANREELTRTDKDARDAQEAFDKEWKAANARALRFARRPEQIEPMMLADPKLQAAMSARDDALMKAALKLVGDAATSDDDKRLKILIRMISARPTSFPGGIGLAKNLYMGTKEGQEFGRGVDEAAEANEQANETAIERRKAREAAAKKAAEDQKAKEREDQAIFDAEKRVSDLAHKTETDDEKKRAAAEKRDKAAADRAARSIVRGTSHEFRQGIADIRARPDMAPEEKGAALAELRRQLEANRGNLTDVVTRDIRQKIDAAYRAAAQQLQTQQVKAARQGRPTAEIQAAAEPMVQYAVAQGVPAGKARHDVTQNLERLLSQQYNLMQAYMLTEEIMDSYVQKALRDTAELQRRQAMQSGRQRRMGGAGNPSLQQIVRPGN